MRSAGAWLRYLQKTEIWYSKASVRRNQAFAQGCVATVGQSATSNGEIGSSVKLEGTVTWVYGRPSGVLPRIRAHIRMVEEKVEAAWYEITQVPGVNGHSAKKKA